MGIIEDAKSVVSLVQKIDNLELYRQILNLQAEIANLVGENGQLKSQIEEIKSKLETKEKLSHRNGAYWLKLSGIEDGPFCTLCWDVEKLTVRLMDVGNGTYICANHEDRISVTPYGRSKGEEYY